MKNFKYYLVFILSFLFNPFGVSAEISSFPNFSYSDDLFTKIVDESLLLNPNLDTIIVTGNFSNIYYIYGVRNVSFYNNNITRFVGDKCSYLLLSNGKLSSGSSFDCKIGNVFDGFVFWSNSDKVLGQSSDLYLFGDSVLDSSFYSYGNTDYLYSNSLKYESMFYRHFGYYDFSNLDNEPPLISLVGNNDITLEINSIWNDPGFSCSDNVDSSCNVNVSSDLNVNALGDYTITYNATDSAGNIAEAVYRYVHVVDTIPPEISLIGDSVIHLSLDSEYEELGVNLSDNSNEDIIPHIDSSSLDINNVGTYYINYLACDSSDNCSSLKRVVKVQLVVPLDFSGSQYLLFDFSDIQDMFPKINFSGLSNTDEFIIVILFNIFFLIFIFIIIWIILKSVYKCISIIWG